MKKLIVLVVLFLAACAPIRECLVLKRATTIQRDCTPGVELYEKYGDPEFLKHCNTKEVITEECLEWRETEPG